MAKQTVYFKAAPLSKKLEAALKDVEMLEDYVGLRRRIKDFNRLAGRYSREVRIHRTRTKPGQRAARNVINQLRTDGKGMNKQELSAFRMQIEYREAREARVPQNFLRRIVGKMLRDNQKAQKAIKSGRPPARKLQLEPLSDIQAVKILSLIKSERRPIRSNRICRGTPTA